MHGYVYTSTGGFNWLFFLCIVAVVWIYFFPTLLAMYREAKHVVWIFIINLLLGTTGLGWIGALVWAIMDETYSSENVNISGKSKATELEKLYNLLQKGGITQEEYDKAKKKILK